MLIVEHQDMTTNRSMFFRLEEQDTNMQVELGDDGNYPMPRLGFISPIVSGRSFGAP
jgi:hypothetical protein